MSMKRCRMTIRTTVPPGYSVVGVQPQTLFRLERAKLPHQPGLWLGHAIGQFLPFDGHIHDIRGIDGTTLCMGGMFAFQVRNDNGEPRPLEMQVGGTAVDWTTPEVGHATVIGLFAQEAIEEPERDDEAEAELVVAVLPRLIPQLDEAGVERLATIAGTTVQALTQALETVDGREWLKNQLLEQKVERTVLKDPGLSYKPRADGDGLTFELTPELFEALEAESPGEMRELVDKLGMTRDDVLTELETPEGRTRIGAALTEMYRAKSA